MTTVHASNQRFSQEPHIYLYQFGGAKYVYGALNRMKGYGLDPAQMQLQGGGHLLMELKAAGWRRVWAIIKGARPEILDGLVKRILMEEAKYGCIE